MPRVKCPHCGAGNQDATEQDTCWQCGNVLGAPIARSQGQSRTAVAEASAPTQQLDPAQIQFATGAGAGQSSQQGGVSQRTLAVAAAVAVLVVAAVVIVFVWLSMK